MKFNADKMRSIARPSTTEEKAMRQNRTENAEWLNTSAKIALNIRAVLRRLSISQVELAARMDVSPAQVTKILSGKENLGLKDRECLGCLTYKRTKLRNGVTKTIIYDYLNINFRQCLLISK